MSSKSMVNSKPVHEKIQEAHLEDIVRGENLLELYVANLKRKFDFTFLRDIFSEPISLRISGCLAEFFSKYARDTSIGRYLSFKELFTWVSQQQALKCSFRSCSGKELLMLDRVFEKIIHSWSETQESKYKERLTTLGEKINNLNRCFDVLQAEAIFPPFQRYVMRKNYHGGRGRRKSLVELSNKNYGSSDIVNSIKGRIQKLDPKISDDELNGLLGTLLSSNSAEALASDDALADAMLRKTTELLSLIRTLSEDKFIQWMQVYDYGQLLLEKGSHSASDELSAILRLGPRERTGLLDNVFPPHDLEQSLANFLQLCVREYDGMVPTANQFGDAPLFAKLMRRFGGKYYVSAMLNAHSDAVAAAMLMYLVDSGANVSVALAIPTDFEWPTDEQGWYEVRSVKSRAGYKPIINTFPEKDSSLRITVIEALRRIRLSTQRARLATPGLIDKLFIHCFFEKPSAANDEFLSNRLRYFQRDADAEKFRLIPSAIRVSFLIKHVLSGDGDILSAEILADHAVGTGVSEGYTLRWPVRVLYVKRIREFNESLQHQLIFGVDDAARLFGTSVNLAEKVLTNSERTGIGLSCKSSGFVSEISVDAPQRCTRVGQCLSCEMKLFYVTKENLVDVLLVHEYLTRRQSELEAQAPARWEALYLPMLAFAAVVIEKVSRSRHAQMLKVAKVECDRLLSSGWSLPI